MDYYYDYDDPEESVASGEYERYMEEEDGDDQWNNVLSMCIQPSLSQASGYILALLASNVACRVLWYINRSLHSLPWLYHACSMICGFSILYLNTGVDFLIVIFVCFMAYVLILTVDYIGYSSRGIIVTIALITSQIIYEMLWDYPESWQRIRGIQMIATMKIISLAFDMDWYNAGKRKKNMIHLNADLVPYLGYIFCPATCLMGPWIPYSCYLKSTQQKLNHNGRRWILWLLVNAIFAALFLCLSNCVVPLLYYDTQRKWIVAFRDALSVRCSHYFVSFTSQASLAAAGVLSREVNPLLGYMVTKPWYIEFPRSLSSLVRFWNIPMHDWLKCYVFHPLRSGSESYSLALIGTYIVSALLHGLHVKIYIILLSLAVFAYAESLLRSKLAHIFNACISANFCKKPCKYIHCWNNSNNWRTSIIIWSTNLLFSLLAILHLAYLGIILHNPNTSADIRRTWFDIKEEVRKWAELDYVSHWISALTFLCYYTI